MSQTVSEPPITLTVPVNLITATHHDEDGEASRPIEQFRLGSSAENVSAEDETHYPSGAQLTVILMLIFMILIVACMDTTMVAIAVPSLTDEWHRISDIGWYSSAYRLCMCSFQFMFGKLYKLFSVKRIFMISISIFFVGNALSGAAPSSAAFILGRAICGFSMAGIVSGCFTLLAQALPLRKRAIYAGIAGAVEGIGTLASPVVGGLILENLGWRYCFYLVLPLIGIAWIASAIFLEDLTTTAQRPRKQILNELDLVGNLVFVPSLTCLFMALSWGGTKYSWSSPIMISLLCIFAVLLVVFAIDQWLRQDSATLPPKVLKNRTVLAGFMFSLCCSGALNMFEYYLPTYLQSIKEYSASRSGLLMLPIVSGFLLSLLLQGTGVNLVGYYVPFMLAGSILMPIFAGLMTTLTISTGMGELIAYSSLLGFAAGIGFQAPQVAVQNTLPAHDSHMGLAVILFAQGFGPAVSIALAQGIFVNRLRGNLGRIGQSINSSDIENMGLGDLKKHVGVEHLKQALLGFDESLMQTWYLGVALTCVTLVGSASMEWKSIKQKRN